MTREDWYRDNANHIQLAQALESEPLKSALQVLVDSELSISQGYSEANPIEHAAIVGQNRDGYFRFLRKLKGLAKDKETALTEEALVPWGHVKP
jgi:hypothetical protein